VPRSEHSSATRAKKLDSGKTATVSYCMADDHRAWIAQMSKTLLNESLEVVWLASLVGGLSALGVGLAVALVLWGPTVAAYV
jgi:hypothetical protein